MASTIEISDRVNKIGAFPFAAFQSIVTRRRANKLPILDFGVGDPSEPVPEFIQAALCSSVGQTTSYPSVLGSPELRQTISDYLKRRFSCTICADTMILPTLGSKEAVYHTPFLVANSKQQKQYAIYGTPGYFVMEKGAIMAGLTPYPVALNQSNGYLLDLTSLPTDILDQAALVWFNYPHNPSGTTCSLEFLRAQYEVAKRHSILFCSDETYADIYFNEPPPSALQIGSLDGLLVFHSCSKRSGMTGYRSGFVAGDPRFIETFARFRNTIGNAPAYFVQEAARAAWNNDEHAALRRTQFHQKQSLVADFLMDKQLRFTQPDGTFYLWVQAPDGKKGMEYGLALLDKGIIVSPGDFFGELDSLFFRVSLSPSLNELEQLARLW